MPHAAGLVIHTGVFKETVVLSSQKSMHKILGELLVMHGNALHVPEFGDELPFFSVNPQRDLEPDIPEGFYWRKLGFEVEIEREEAERAKYGNAQGGDQENAKEARTGLGIP